MSDGLNLRCGRFCVGSSGGSRRCRHCSNWLCLLNRLSLRQTSLRSLLCRRNSPACRPFGQWSAFRCNRCWFIRRRRSKRSLCFHLLPRRDRRYWCTDLVAGRLWWCFDLYLCFQLLLLSLPLLLGQLARSFARRRCRCSESLCQAGCPD